MASAPIRGVGYRFGDDQEMRDAAATNRADALLFDLQDSVAATGKSAACRRIAAACRASRELGFEGRTMGEPVHVGGRIVEPGYLAQARRLLDLEAAIAGGEAGA